MVSVLEQQSSIIWHQIVPKDLLIAEHESTKDTVANRGSQHHIVSSQVGLRVEHYRSAVRVDNHQTLSYEQKSQGHESNWEQDRKSNTECHSDEHDDKHV